MQGDINKERNNRKKEEYKVIKEFDKNGESFQKVMEKILINKLNNM